MFLYTVEKLKHSDRRKNLTDSGIGRKLLDSCALEQI